MSYRRGVMDCLDFLKPWAARTGNDQRDAALLLKVVFEQALSLADLGLREKDAMPICTAITRTIVAYRNRMEPNPESHAPERIGEILPRAIQEVHSSLPEPVPASRLAANT